MSDEPDQNVCTYPDCGCDGSRLCYARNPTEMALGFNVEGMWTVQGKHMAVARRKAVEAINAAALEGKS